MGYEWGSNYASILTGTTQGPQVSTIKGRWNPGNEGYTRFHYYINHDNWGCFFRMLDNWVRNFDQLQSSLSSVWPNSNSILGTRSEISLRGIEATPVPLEISRSNDLAVASESNISRIAASHSGGYDFPNACGQAKKNQWNTSFKKWNWILESDVHQLSLHARSCQVIQSYLPRVLPLAPQTWRPKF